MPGRDGEDAFTGSTDDDPGGNRWPRFTERVPHLEVLSLKGDGSFSPQCLHHRHALFEPIDSCCGIIESDSRRRIVALLVTRAEADLYPPLGGETERCDFPREHDTVAEIVVEHEGAHVEAGSRLGGH